MSTALGEDEGAVQSYRDGEQKTEGPGWGP